MQTNTIYKVDLTFDGAEYRLRIHRPLSGFREYFGTERIPARFIRLCGLLAEKEGKV